MHENIIISMKEERRQKCTEGVNTNTTVDNYLYMTLEMVVWQLNSPSSIMDAWKPQLQFLLIIPVKVCFMFFSICVAIPCM